MEQYKQLLECLNNPIIKTALIAGGSFSFAGMYMLFNKVNNNRFDTITDLKKKAKVFKDNNYKTVNHNKRGL